VLVERCTRELPCTIMCGNSWGEEKSVFVSSVQFQSNFSEPFTVLLSFPVPLCQYCGLFRTECQSTMHILPHHTVLAIERQLKSV
jgi:hypothetical protein